MKVKAVAIPMVYIVSLLVLSLFLNGGTFSNETNAKNKAATALKQELKSDQKLEK